jgi:hypothetical protein
MIRLNKALGFLVLCFAAFALSSTAALGADKQYTLDISPSSGTSPLMVTATFTNQGNSSFNSLTLTPPTGSNYTITGLGASRGDWSLVNGSIQVLNINLPTGTGQYVTVTFTLATSSCAAQSGDWKAVVYTGSSLTGQKFQQVAPSSTSTSVSAVCWTLTYSAGPHGTISGATPQTVANGGSGTAVTAVANPGYRFVRWSDGSTANPRTDTNVTGNISVTANFVGTLAWGTQPHGALAGGLIGPVTVTGTGLDGDTITLSLGPSGTLTGNTATMTGGVATFNDVKTAADTPAGQYTLTASDTTNADVQPVSSNAFTVSANNGILTCPTDTNPPTGAVTSFDINDTSSSYVDSTGSRTDNKEGSPCVAIPFSVVASVSPVHKITVNWDELAQPNVALEIHVTWPPELVGAGMLPKPTYYDIGLGTFLAGQCLATSATPADPPEQIGTLNADIDASQTSIPMSFTKLPPYPFPIILRSSASGTDPERMLVTGADGSTAGNYIVVRATGLTPASQHTNGFPVMWTPMPVDDGSGTNAPAGAQVQTCVFDETTTPVDLALCGPQTSEPLQPCVQATQKLRVTGDWLISK